MGIRLAGMISGLDTDSIVKGLMKAQRTKQDKVKSKKQKLEWKQDIWKDLNKKVYGFYNDYASKMRLQGSYGTKSATSSDTSKITATTTNAAVKGSYDVKVNAIAAAQYVTSGKLEALEDGEKVTTSTKLSDIGVGNNASGAFEEGTQIVVQSGDKTATLEVDSDTTVQNFLDTLKSAGLNASFDTSQQRFFISSSASGADHAFTITSGTFTSEQMDKQEDLKNLMGYDSLDAGNKSKVNSVMTKLQYGAGEEADIKDAAVSSLMEISDADAKSKVEKHLSDGFKEDKKNSYFSGGDATDAGRAALIDSGVSESAYNLMTNLEREEQIDALIAKQTKDYMKLDSTKDRINDALEHGLSDGGEQIVKAKAERNAEITNQVTGYYSQFHGVDIQETDALAALKLGNITGDAVAEGDLASGMTVTKATDSEIVYNGATLKSDSSTMTINGLTLDLHGVTNGNTVKITVSNDTTAVYDSIKDFLTQYNSVLTELSGKYNASSAKDYDVLTDEQKEAMSDSEVEKWNDKIKDSLLRRDSTVGDLMSTMREAMSITYTASDGKRYSLASLGITTSQDYKEGGLLHIQGDEDDTEYKDKTNKLMNMLNEDPSLVTEILSGITSNLYSKLGNKMAATSMSSALTFYNDKEMTKQVDTYKKEVKEWDSKLQTMENKYYKQFSAMETAMSKMQSQQTALGGLTS